MSLNTPDMRQRRLAARLPVGGALDMAALAAEFGVSVDTIRRDLIALEDRGLVERVRGGAVPVSPPHPPQSERRSALPESLLERARLALGPARTIVMDGGTSVAALAARLEPLPGLLILTPAPAVALAALARGIEVELIGGTLSARGALATGAGTCAALAAVRADIAVLGACGLEAGFGLSTDDAAESAVKAAMALSAGRVMVLTGHEKIGRRARHRTLACETLDLVLTDRPAPSLAEVGIEVIHA